MIKAARLRLEQYTDQRFISQTWRQFMDFWPMQDNNLWWDGVRDGSISTFNMPATYIELMTGPMTSVTTFNTYGDDGVAVLFDPANYVLDASGPYGRIALKMGGVWPTTVLRKVNGIEITFVAGVAADAATLPNDIKQAVLDYVGILYENRGDEKIAMPVTSMALLEPYRRLKVG
jgi:uncharacterized phiE125 gp8 family phage protein